MSLPTPPQLKLPYRIYRYVEYLKEESHEKHLGRGTFPRLPPGVRYVLSKEELEELRRIFAELGAETRQYVYAEGREAMQEISQELRTWLHHVEEAVNERVREFSVETERWYEKLLERLKTQLHRELGQYGDAVAKVIAAELAQKISQVATKLGRREADQLVHYLAQIAAETAQRLKVTEGRNLVETLQKVTKEVVDTANKVLREVETETEQRLRKLEKAAETYTKELEKQTLSWYSRLLTSLKTRLEAELGQHGVKLAEEIAEKLAGKITQVANRLGTEAAEEVVNYLTNVTAETVQELKKRGTRNIVEALNEVAQKAVSAADQMLKKLEAEAVQRYRELSSRLEQALSQRAEQIYTNIVTQLSRRLGAEGEKLAKKIFTVIEEAAREAGQKYGSLAAQQIRSELLEYAQDVLRQAESRGRHILAELSTRLTNIIQEKARQLLDTYNKIATELGDRLAKYLHERGYEIASQVAAYITDKLRSLGQHGAQIVMTYIENYVKTHLGELKNKTVQKVISDLRSQIDNITRQILAEKTEAIRTVLEKKSTEIYHQVAQRLAERLEKEFREATGPTLRASAEKMERIALTELASRLSGVQSDDEMSDILDHSYHLLEKLGLSYQGGGAGGKFDSYYYFFVKNPALVPIIKSILKRYAGRGSPVAADFVKWGSGYLLFIGVRNGYERSRRAWNLVGRALASIIESALRLQEKTGISVKTLQRDISWLVHTHHRWYSEFHVGNLVVRSWHPGWPVSSFVLHPVKVLERTLPIVAGALAYALERAERSGIHDLTPRAWYRLRNWMVQWLRQHGYSAGIVEPGWHEIYLWVPGVGKVYYHPPELAGYLYILSRKLGYRDFMSFLTTLESEQKLLVHA